MQLPKGWCQVSRWAYKWFIITLCCPACWDVGCVQLAQWDGHVRELGWVSPFQVPSETGCKLHIHSKVSAAGDYRCGLQLGTQCSADTWDTICACIAEGCHSAEHPGKKSACQSPSKLCCFTKVHSRNKNQLIPIPWLLTLSLYRSFWAGIINLFFKALPDFAVWCPVPILLS